MPWVKLDAGFPDHPKVTAAGWRAAWLYVCGLTYCSRYLTDGRIQKVHIPRLSDIPKPHVQAQRLVDAGLWIDMGNHYLVHDYMEWQTPAQKVEREREAGRKRAAASAEARAKKSKPSGEESKSSPEDREPDVDVDVDVETSSSSSPPPRTTEQPNEESEEEEVQEATPAQLAELERRWVQRQTPGDVAKYGPVKDVRRWRAATLASIKQAPVAPSVAEPLRPYDREPCPNPCAGGWLLDDDSEPRYDQDGSLVRCPACAARSVNA